MKLQTAVVCGPQPNGKDVSNRIIKEDYSANYYDDLALLRNEDYQHIFGNPRYKDSNKRKRLAIVKITNPETGKSIQRAYRGERSCKGEQIGLTSNSIRFLSNEDIDKPITVIVKKGSVFAYFWNHPFHATRISMKLGVYSLIFSILGLLVGVAGIVISCLK